MRWTVGVVLVPMLAAAAFGWFYLLPRREDLLVYAVQPDILVLVMIGCLVLMMVWLGVVLSTYLRTRPSRATPMQHLGGTLLAIVMCLVVTVPLATGAYYANVQRDLVTTVVNNEQTATAPTIRNITKANPWGDKKRVNLLLLGGDGGVGRTGIRTDSVILFSMDTDTGEAVMFSLPRNLQRAPFPPGSPLAAFYPNGFEACCNPGESMLNAIYRNVPAAHPGALGKTDNEGADAVKQAVSGALGIPVDYYLLVNLNGFQQIVDAIGGITVNINEPVPINGDTDRHIPPTGYLKPGPNQHLNGFKALWFTRGRYGSTDYKRMERQRCAMNAIVKEAKPVKLLTRYTQLASASKKILRTDIPQEVLPAFVDTALKLKDHPLRSVVFQLSAAFNPNQPNYDYVHAAVRKALAGRSPKGIRAGVIRSTRSAVKAGNGALDVPVIDSPGDATDVDSDCTYQPVSASGSTSTTP